MVVFKYVWSISHFRRFKEDKTKKNVTETDRQVSHRWAVCTGESESRFVQQWTRFGNLTVTFTLSGRVHVQNKHCPWIFLHILTTYPSKRTRCPQQNYVQEHHQSIDIWFVSISVSNWTNAWKKNITFGRSVIRKQWLPKWDMPGHPGDFHHGPMAGIPANRGNMTCASLGQLISCLIKMTRFCQGIPMFIMFVVCCWNLHGLFEEKDAPKYNDCFLLIMF